MAVWFSVFRFELRAWTDQFGKWFQIRSELAVALYDAVGGAEDITFPFPQREVRLLHDSDNKSEVVLAPGVSQTSLPEGHAEPVSDKKETGRTRGDK